MSQTTNEARLAAGGTLAAVLFALLFLANITPENRARGAETAVRLELERPVAVAEYTTRAEVAPWVERAWAGVKVAGAAAAALAILAAGLAVALVIVRLAWAWRPVQRLPRVDPVLVQAAGQWFILDPATGRQAALGRVEHPQLMQARGVQVALEAQGMQRRAFWQAVSEKALEAHEE